MSVLQDRGSETIADGQLGGVRPHSAEGFTGKPELSGQSVGCRGEGQVAGNQNYYGWR